MTCPYFVGVLIALGGQAASEDDTEMLRKQRVKRAKQFTLKEDGLI